MLSNPLNLKNFIRHFQKFARYKRSSTIKFRDLVKKPVFFFSKDLRDSINHDKLREEAFRLQSIGAYDASVKVVDQIIK